MYCTDLSCSVPAVAAMHENAGPVVFHFVDYPDSAGENALDVLQPIGGLNA